MTALAAKLATDPVTVFAARAEATAYLVRQRDLDLHEAVDGLQAAAVRTGLVGALGQDAVQAIMAKAYAAMRADADADVVPELGRAGCLGQDDAPHAITTSHQLVPVCTGADQIGELVHRARMSVCQAFVDGGHRAALEALALAALDLGACVVNDARSNSGA